MNIIEDRACVNRSGVCYIMAENLIHKVFGAARLDVEIKDRFGQPIVPREWFLAPLFAVDEAVSRIRDGTITGYVYDPKTAKLVLAAALDR